MDYRIIIETELSGKEWFYLQRKRLSFLWFYICVYNYCGRERQRFESLQEVKDYIQNVIKYDYEQAQKKIKSRRIIYNW